MRLLKNSKGQGMTEYILLVALIAIAAIVAVKYFGKKTGDSFTNSANTISNNVNTQNRNAGGI